MLIRAIRTTTLRDKRNIVAQMDDLSGALPTKKEYKSSDKFTISGSCRQKALSIVAFVWSTGWIVPKKFCSKDIRQSAMQRSGSCVGWPRGSERIVIGCLVSVSCLTFLTQTLAANVTPSQERAWPHVSNFALPGQRVARQTSKMLFIGGDDDLAPESNVRGCDAHIEVF